MNKTSSIIILILISTLTLDTIISIVYDLIGNPLDSSWGEILFIAISVIILVVGLVLLLVDIKKRSHVIDLGLNKGTSLGWAQTCDVSLLKRDLIDEVLLRLMCRAGKSEVRPKEPIRYSLHCCCELKLLSWGLPYASNEPEVSRQPCIYCSCFFFLLSYLQQLVILGWNLGDENDIAEPLHALRNTFLPAQNNTGFRDLTPQKFCS